MALRHSSGMVASSSSIAPPPAPAAWYAALTLPERLDHLDRNSPTALVTPDEAARANRWLARWRSQPPFSNLERFAQRLMADDLDEAALLRLLGEPAETLRDRQPAAPAWMERLGQALHHPASTELSPHAATESSTTMLDMMPAVAPLITYGRDRLRAALAILTANETPAPFSPAEIEAALLPNLPMILLPIMSRTLVLELQVARLEERLTGATAGERFRAFFADLGQPPALRALLNEYPVLGRLLLTVVERWADIAAEVLGRLVADWSDIVATFSPDGDPGRLTGVSGGAGDTHRGGRSVWLLQFEHGLRLVYKPRSLAVDRHFQRLLHWLNERGFEPAFRTLTLLDRDDYGWIEFVAAAPCADTLELQRFYERQGGYLALLYALHAVDVHHENLIAAGEHPVMIDLEALFHPETVTVAGTDAATVAGRALYDSALAVGLLPQRFWRSEDSDGIDLSGLGGAGGQLTPHAVAAWAGAGTDEMHLVREHLPLAPAANRPSLAGAEPDVTAYRETIVAGFTRLYNLLRAHRAAFVADDGPLSWFADAEVRVILRATRTYSLLLHESYHPDVLRNALARDQLFDRLWGMVEALPHLARVIDAERADLYDGDIPAFTTRPGSTDLWTSRGDRLTHFVSESGLDLARRRLARLNDEDLAHQQWVIRASLMILAGGDERTSARSVGQPRARCADGAVDGQRLLAGAWDVGDRLAAVARHGHDDAAWLGLSQSQRGAWRLAPVSLDLYDGQAGIVLFLAYLGLVTGEARYTDLARAGLNGLRRRLEEAQTELTTVGAFGGWGSPLYLLTHLGALWHEPALLAEAEAIVARLPELIARDDELDIIVGTAGCLGALLALHRTAPSAATMAVAVQSGEHLLARAQPTSSGLAWPPRGGALQPLAGFSHGASGIAWALLQLGVMTGDARFREAALAGFAYERSLFDPAHGNWPDLRESEGLPIWLSLWCHGAAGIGMARLQAIQHLDDPELRQEARVALRTTLAEGFGLNHSLCHGDLGNLDLFLQAARLEAPGWETAAWQRLTRRLTATILTSIERHGVRCGTPAGIESPGLMTGLAGVGYQLLRLAAPERVPSVLVLAPPAV